MSTVLARVSLATSWAEFFDLGFLSGVGLLGLGDGFPQTFFGLRNLSGLGAHSLVGPAGHDAGLAETGSA